MKKIKKEVRMEEKDDVKVNDVEVKENPQEVPEDGVKKKKVGTIVIATIMSVLVICLITSASWCFGREVKTIAEKGYNPEYLKVYLKDGYRWPDIDEEDINWDNIISDVYYYGSDFVIVELKEYDFRKTIETVALLYELYFVKKVTLTIFQPAIPEGGIFS